MGSCEKGRGFVVDTIIKGGTIVDGLGGEPYAGDIAIKDGRIVEIGRIGGTAKQVIDADGAIVTPGFVDIHTHYDGQFLWDDKLDPSFSHGVTTAIAGNCGVGFAPVQAEHRQELIELMSGVEDIPDLVLDEGLDWEWKSFPDYMDRVAARSYGMDVATHITHAPLRLFVMGERALRDEAATDDDLAAMSGLVREAMAAGAVGFSTGRFVEHRSSKGKLVPGTHANEDEVLALATAMGELGTGVFQIILRGSIGNLLLHPITREERLLEHRLLERIARQSGRPCTYGIAEFPGDTDDLFMMTDASAAALAEGVPIYPQTSPRGAGQINNLEGYHAFLLKPSYRELMHLPLAERVRLMRYPEIRKAILTEANMPNDAEADPLVAGLVHYIQSDLPNSFILASPLDYEPGPERSVGVLATAAGKTPEEYVYDHYTKGDGTDFNVSLALNYVHQNLDAVEKLLSRPHVVSGLGDGGAHMKLICDAANPTFQLAFWSRDRSRGPRLPLAAMVNKQSAAAAKLYGLHDRGSLEVGKRADINVIDFDRLGMKMPHMAYDLPSGGGRLLLESEGYLATLVAGTVTRRNDQDSGARPGRLVRANRLS